MRTNNSLRSTWETISGSGLRPNEDRVFSFHGGAILLDGATGAAAPLTGGWYADQLGTELCRRIPDRSVDLSEALGDAIAYVAERWDLQPGTSPSATVSIVRVVNEYIEVLVLGDSPVAIADVDGFIKVVKDDRLSKVAAGERAELRNASVSDKSALRARLVQAESANRNKPGGYWIAEASSDAAQEAIRTTVATRRCRGTLMMSDGVSIGVERYGVPKDWHEAYLLASRSPSELIATVKGAEDSDPECVRWPRSKRSDDKAVALLEFNEAN